MPCRNCRQGLKAEPARDFGDTMNMLADKDSASAARLLSNVYAAAENVWPHYVRSILGNRDSWNPQACPQSEVGHLRGDGFWQALDELVQVTVPALPLRLRGLDIPGTGLLLRPCEILPRPRPDGMDPWPHESWMFINGICTDQHLARVNADYLIELFGRPITILYDSTCGVIPDLIECAAGKGWGSLTAAGRQALQPLAAALLNPAKQRVVLVCHSRGTIIAAAVLHALGCALSGDSGGNSSEAKAGRQLCGEWREHSAPLRRVRRRKDVQSAMNRHGGAASAPEANSLTAAHLRKLEVYAIANCASDMRYLVPAEGAVPAAPYIESIGNEHDLVARLGVLASRKGEGSVCIDGNGYRRDGAWGHLLNAHYLCPLERDVKEARNRLTPLEGTTQPSRLEAMVRTGSAVRSA